jgi:Ca-activated chloride channel homolog
MLSRRAALALGLASFAARAQQVSIQPRPKPAPKDETTPSKPTLRVDTSLVLIPVTVTDPLSRPVTGLEKENFRLTDDLVEQTITQFAMDDSPVAVGMVFDTSGSMGSKLDRSRMAATEFFRTSNPGDEFFLVQFDNSPRLEVPLTENVGAIENQLIFSRSKGSTALLDAIYLALHEMRRSKKNKKALLIISDGGDNHSRYTEGEIKSTVKEADLLMYAIGIYDRYMSTPEEQLGPALLSELTELTGGRAFTIDNPNDLADVATKIGIELRNQYVLGYRPKNPTHDGKWRKIKVKLIAPKGLPPLRVYAKTGYYAPSQ